MLEPACRSKHDVQGGVGKGTKSLYYFDIYLGGMGKGIHVATVLRRTCLNTVTLQIYSH